MQKAPESTLLTLLKLKMWSIPLGISGEEKGIFRGHGKTMSCFVVSGQIVGKTGPDLPWKTYI